MSMADDNEQPQLTGEQDAERSQDQSEPSAVKNALAPANHLLAYIHHMPAANNARAIKGPDQYDRRPRIDTRARARDLIF
jgi:hypothetical protein